MSSASVAHTRARAGFLQVKAYWLCGSSLGTFSWRDRQAFERSELYILVSHQIPSASGEINVSQLSMSQSRLPLGQTGDGLPDEILGMDSG
jgi:hypothetical protein